MQFYIIHPDPETSARNLPDYALKRVNIREGYQILSDIGHILGIHWEGQNKLYSASHALTRHFCSDPNILKEFLRNYTQCCMEYERRYKKSHKYIDLFYSNYDYILTLPRLCYKSKYESTLKYLLEEKTSKLSEVDKLTLNKFLEVKNDTAKTKS
jgi:hypothetical protein